MKQLNRLQADISHYREKMILCLHYNDRELSINEGRALQIHRIQQYLDTLNSLIMEAENALSELQKNSENNRREIEAIQRLLGFVRRGKFVEPEPSIDSEGNGQDESNGTDGDKKYQGTYRIRGGLLMETMKLWNLVSKTDPSHTKAVTFGRKFTAIDAMYQIQTATEQWGSFGAQWGVRGENFIINTITPELVLLAYTAEFYYPEGVFPIHSSLTILSRDKNNNLKLDDEGYKKVATDALTKGLSKLGFNADVFLGKFDDNRYVSQMKEEFSEKPKQKTEYIDQPKFDKKVQEAKDKVLAEYERARKAMFATAKEAGLDGVAVKPALQMFFVNRWDTIDDVSTKSLSTEELIDFTKHLKELKK